MAVTEVTFYPPYNLRYGHASGKPDLVGQNGTASDGTSLSDGDQCNDVADGRRSAKLTIDTNGESGDAAIDLTSADTASNIDAANWDFFIIDNHNLDTATAGGSAIEIRSGDLTGTGDLVGLSSAVSGTLGSATAACTVGSHIITDPVADGITVITTTSSNANSIYRRLHLDRASSNNYAADITIGEITMGKKFTAPFRPDLGVGYDNQYSGVTVNTSQGGQSYSTKRFGRKRVWSLNFNLFDATAKSNFETFFDIVEGRRLPFHFSLNSDSATPTFYYGRLGGSTNITEVALERYSCKLQIVEEI
ncbi:MAG: hypothetical protein Unbinned400contig1004_48 [Prokaryotic dsDNA virus sp.]|nr:MAG: hypothetical protein Unbinned400contig1004_48 [Prokaryotic dsDNA virus sp.]|tara:strand:- start:1477 stop:2394 length:918 start_codon:yes stop_codon:yes gene_type:complete